MSTPIPTSYTDAELRQIDCDMQRRVFGSTDFRQLPVFRDEGHCHVTDQKALDWSYSNVSLDWCYLPAGKTDEVWCEPVPLYTTCWKAMGRLMDRVLEQQYVKVNLNASYWHGDYCSIVAPDPSQIDPTDLVKRDALSVWGQSMPVAFCLALLHASSVGD